MNYICIKIVKTFEIIGVSYASVNLFL